MSNFSIKHRLLRTSHFSFKFDINLVQTSFISIQFLLLLARSFQFALAHTDICMIFKLYARSFWYLHDFRIICTIILIFARFQDYMHDHSDICTVLKLYARSPIYQKKLSQKTSLTPLTQLFKRINCT